MSENSNDKNLRTRGINIPNSKFHDYDDGKIPCWEKESYNVYVKTSNRMSNFLLIIRFGYDTNDVLKIYQ